MMIQDLVAPFAEFADEKPDDDMTTRWRKRVVEPHAEIYRVIEPWMGVADAGQRLPDLVRSRDELVVRARRAQEAVHRAHSLLRRALPDAGRMNAVVLVGLGKANGWATPVNGTPTLFLAVDRLPEPGYDVVLALHEMLHAEHLRRASHDWPDNRVDADLFREGLAVHVTARLIPEMDASGHLWFAPGHHEWILRCQDREMTLRRRLLADLRRTDRSSAWFSGAADRDGDLPGRCGYWLGWRLLDRMMVDTSLEAAMHWPLPEVSSRLQHLLEEPVPG
ncbi:DUF2268 domain-containing putative Zn-dependent protease [Actinoplanes sp. CA-051413]|uniref:DUF2268 domain-containing putative Zn-dependent protease n=1 Tax=Actinoplanes sp. CA-051413 TaxID=3239899 RepID=UPI003D99E44B